MISTSPPKILQKNLKIPFSNAQNMGFWARDSFKTIF